MLLPVVIAFQVAVGDDALPSDNNASKAAFEAGLTAYAAKDYDKAVAQFQLAHAMHARPEVLYAWAQAERLRGNCRTAIPLYARFVQESSSATARERANEQLVNCKKLQPPPWYEDTWGHVLAAGGLVAAATGGYFFLVSERDYDRAARAETFGDYADTFERAKDERLVAFIGLGVGGALLAGAIGHYTWFARRVPASVGAAASREGGAIVVRWSM